MAEVSDAVLKVKEVPSDKSKPLLLTRLPLEIRYQIFDQLLNSYHTIIISPNGQQRGVLKPLVQVCKQMRDEVQKWLEGKKEGNIIRSLAFGVFNDKVTTFKMCWVDNCSLLFQLGFPVDKNGSCTLQRCYFPGHPARDLEKLGMWQRAMDVKGTNCRSKINIALRNHPQFKGYHKGFDDRKLLGWQPDEDWSVLDPKEYEDSLRPIRIHEFVWSDDFETHAEHQEYTRQYPWEYQEVRKLECGLAFEFRLGEDFDFIEVD